MTRKSSTGSTGRKIRYAVVGQGYISQVAVLPAFQHARRNSELVALVSNDPAKLKGLGRRYKIGELCSYDDYEDLLKNGDVDAVYIALPNDMHRDFTVKAFQAGVHVLCEKPMAVTAAGCEAMIRASQDHGVKLMIAYRLHFEEGNLKAIDYLKKRKIGDPRIFNSVFTMAVDPKNYRAGAREEGGGPMFDVGIYCLNAARYLFQSEPTEVFAMAIGANREGKSDSEASMAVTLRFDGDRVANFVCSFEAFATDSFQVVGTKGVLELENAYDYIGSKTIKIRSKGRPITQRFKARDQFGAELLYFSDCILLDRVPEPSGVEGLADLRIIEAIFESADTGRSIPLMPIEKTHPGLRQEIHLPPVKKAKLIGVGDPSKEEAS